MAQEGAFKVRHADVAIGDIPTNTLSRLKALRGVAIAALRAVGATRDEIAAVLGLHEKTVEVHSRGLRDTELSP
jgi:DNA-binding NarL/FixJ family response regulator